MLVKGILIQHAWIKGNLTVLDVLDVLDRALAHVEFQRHPRQTMSRY